MHHRNLERKVTFMLTHTAHAMIHQKADEMFFLDCWIRNNVFVEKRNGQPFIKIYVNGYFLQISPSPPFFWKTFLLFKIGLWINVPL